MNNYIFPRTPLAFAISVTSVFCVLAVSNRCEELQQKQGNPQSEAKRAAQQSQVQPDQRAKAAAPPRVPDVTGRTCVEAQGILERNGFGYECIDQPGPDQRVTRTDPPSGSFEPLRTKVRIYFDVEVPALKGEKVAMALKLLNNVGLLMDQASATPGSGEPGTISSQTPEAHTRILAGATVKVQVVPDQLLLIPPGPIKLQVADILGLQASIVPPRPEARYAFDWGEKAPKQETREAKAEHTYRVPGRYRIQASVTNLDGEMQVESNVIEVDVEPYKVSLTTDPPQPKPGDRVILRAELEPRSSSSPEYRFSFDGEQGTGLPTPNATHIYNAAGNYRVSVDVVINTVNVGSAQATLTVAAPRTTNFPWIWIIGGAAAGILVTTVTRSSVRKRRVRRLSEGIAISAAPVSGSQSLPHHSLVRSDNVVVVRAIAFEPHALPGAGHNQEK